jgi:predicted DNA-binding transcriptional regulator YafY
MPPPIASLLAPFNARERDQGRNQTASSDSQKGQPMTQKDKTQLLRLVYVDKKIREGMHTGNLANCSSMAAEYEVSTKSILRDIDYLKNQCDAPIEYDPGKKGYYYTEQTYKMPAINISASDLFAIAIAQKALQQHENTPIYDKLVNVFERIEESLPDKVTIHPGWIDNRITMIQHQKTTIQARTWSTIAEALQQNMTLAMRYQKPQDPQPSSRLVDPYHLVNYQGEWYLIGRCHLREKILTFAVSRIEHAAATSSTFAGPVNFDHNQYSATQFGIFAGTDRHQVDIFFDKDHAPYILEREWHPSQEITSNADGTLVLSMTTSHLFEVKQWILSWGAGATVISPESLRNEVRDELKRSFEQYG